MLRVINDDPEATEEFGYIVHKIDIGAKSFVFDNKVQGSPLERGSWQSPNRYHVGQKINDITIDEIWLDDTLFLKTGINFILIFAAGKDGKKFIWKQFRGDVEISNDTRLNDFE
jgi:hypothetical protein